MAKLQSSEEIRERQRKITLSVSREREAPAYLISREWHQTWLNYIGLQEELVQHYLTDSEVFKRRALLDRIRSLLGQQTEPDFDEDWGIKPTERVVEQYIYVETNNKNQNEYPAPGPVKQGDLPMHEDVYTHLAKWYGISADQYIKRQYSEYRFEDPRIQSLPDDSRSVGVWVINKHNVSAPINRGEYGFKTSKVKMIFPESVGYIENELRRIFRIRRPRKTRLWLGIQYTRESGASGVNYVLFNKRGHYLRRNSMCDSCSHGHIFQQNVIFYGPKNGSNCRIVEAAIELKDAKVMWPTGVLGEPMGELLSFGSLPQNTTTGLYPDNKEFSMKHGPLSQEPDTSYKQPNQANAPTLDKSNGSRVVLDIGGYRYTTSVLTLTQDPHSMLAAMFSGRHCLPREDDGSYFIDRDGTHFRLVLNYLRDGIDNFRVPDDPNTIYELLIEAKYYQLLELVDILNEHIM